MVYARENLTSLCSRRRIYSRHSELKGSEGDEAGTFIGQDALQKIARDGPRRTLAGLVLAGRRTPRQGMTVSAAGNEVGIVTSGCLSPTLDRPIAMAYLDAGTQGRVEVALGSGSVEAEIVALPFYKRSP